MLFRRFINTKTPTYLLRRYCTTTSKQDESSKKAQPTTNVAPPAPSPMPPPTPIQTKESFSRHGDGGDSQTIMGQTLPKDNVVFHAIGATEELLSFLGLAREHAQEAEHEYSDKLKRIQTVLIDISTAISRSGDTSCKLIEPLHTKELEDWIFKYSKELPPPEQYIVPGGGITSATLHVARSVCRRTERIVTPLVREGNVHSEVLVYLNRLADFLFTVSRIAAKLDKRTETIYIPKPDQKIQAQVLYATNM